MDRLRLGVRADLEKIVVIHHIMPRERTSGFFGRLVQFESDDVSVVPLGTMTHHTVTYWILTLGLNVYSGAERHLHSGQDPNARRREICPLNLRRMC